MSAQVYHQDGEIVIDKGGHRMCLPPDEAIDVASQIQKLIPGPGAMSAVINGVPVEITVSEVEDGASVSVAISTSHDVAVQVNGHQLSREATR